MLNNEFGFSETSCSNTGRKFKTRRRRNSQQCATILKDIQKRAITPHKRLTKGGVRGVVASPATNYVTFPRFPRANKLCPISHRLQLQLSTLQHQTSPHHHHFGKLLTALHITLTGLIILSLRTRQSQNAQTRWHKMKISLSSVLLLALAAESTVASSWFGGATKAGSYLFQYCDLAIWSPLNTMHLSIHRSILLIPTHAYPCTSRSNPIFSI